MRSQVAPRLQRDDAMLLFPEHHDALVYRLRDAPAVSADLISEVIGNSSRRLPVRIERLIESAAWTDATLALLELELPHWRLRRSSPSLRSGLYGRDSRR